MKPRGIPRTSLSAIWCLFLAVWLGEAGAGGIGISPIRVNLSNSAPTAALTLENSGGEAAVVQLQMMAWSVDGEEDIYQPTYEIVATPPITTIAPGQLQIVRVGLSRDADPEQELAYRLYIEEVPPPPQPGHQGLRVALRIGVPVFIQPDAPVQPEVTWRARRNDAGGLTIIANNAGGAHLRLMNLKLQQTGAVPTLAQRQIVGYLLPGQERRWDLPLSGRLPDGRLRLTVVAEPSVDTVDLELENP